MPAKHDLTDSLFYALVAILGFFLVFFATDKYGPGVSPDSINYVAAARSLSSGRGFLQYNGAPFAHWPPLFSTILAAGTGLGFDALSFARFFNALCFGLTIFCFGRLVLRLIDTQVLRAIAVLTAALSFPLLKMFVMVWSEPFFILLVLIFFEWLARMHATETYSTRDVLMLAGLAACACLQRYLGVVLILCGAASLFRPRTIGLKQKVVSVSLYCCLSVLPLVLWIVRNQTLVGEAAGDRVSSTTTLLLTMRDFLVVWTNWFLPFDSAITVRIALFVLVTCLVMYFVFTGADQSGRGAIAVRNQLIFDGGIFILAYSGVLIVITVAIAVEPISQRYLSPIFPICLLFAFKAIEVFARWCEAQGVPSRRINLASLALAVIMLGESTVTAYQVVSIWRYEGAGDYTNIRWEQSELLKWLAQHPLEGQIYSNAADLIYLKTGVIARPLAVRGSDLAAWRRGLPGNVRYYCAWFGQSFRRHLATPEELSSVFRLNLIVSTKNEVLFELK